MLTMQISFVYKTSLKTDITLIKAKSTPTKCWFYWQWSPLKWLDWVCSPVRVAGKSPLMGESVPLGSSGNF